MNLEKEIFDISLQDIIPNRFQPREIFNDEQLNELAQSIKEHGVIQPIIVRKVGDKYEIIAGERRFRASQLAGKETIPALVRDIDDKEAAKIALLENLQRSNLTPIEEAKTYQTILKIDNITQDELAQNLGKSQSTIANKLRLLTLNDDVQTALLNSQISERHARSLLGLSHNDQTRLLNKIVNEKLTVRQLDEEVARLTGRVSSEYQEEPQVIAQPSIQINDIQTEIKPNIEEPINIFKQEQPIVENKPEIKNTPLQETKPNIEEPIKREENIFDRLRVNNNSTTIDKLPNPDISTVISDVVEEPEENKYDNIYDLRFAINNFRQAIQNTEKFGFKVKANEYDTSDKYQIVIEIDKNK